MPANFTGYQQQDDEELKRKSTLNQMDPGAVELASGNGRGAFAAASGGWDSAAVKANEGTPQSSTGFMAPSAAGAGALAAKDPVQQAGATVGTNQMGATAAGNASGQRGDANWVQFTNDKAGYTGEGAAFDASAGRTGQSSAAAAARGNLQPLIDEYNKKYGTQAKVVSGDKVDFGNGPQDVIRDSGNGTSGFWLQEGDQPAAAGGQSLGEPQHSSGFLAPASAGRAQNLSSAASTATPSTAAGMVERSDEQPAWDTPPPGSEIPNQPDFVAQQPGRNISNPGQGQDIAAPQGFQPLQAGQLPSDVGKPQSEVDVKSRQAILDMMQQAGKPVDMNDPALRQQSEAYASARNRQAQQQRTAMAERNAASGLNSGGQGSGSFNSGLNSILSSAGRDVAGNDAQLMGKEIDAKRNQLQQALQMATSVGARDEANQIQTELAKLDNEYRYAGLNENARQSNADLTYRTAATNQGNARDYASLRQQGEIANQGNEFNYANLNQQGKLSSQDQKLRALFANQSNQKDWAALGQQGKLTREQMAQTGKLTREQMDLQKLLGLDTNSISRQSLGQNQSQWNDRYGLDREKMRMDADREAMLQALGR